MDNRDHATQQSAGPFAADNDATLTPLTSITEFLRILETSDSEQSDIARLIFRTNGHGLAATKAARDALHRACSHAIVRALYDVVSPGTVTARGLEARWSVFVTSSILDGLLDTDTPGARDRLLEEWHWQQSADAPDQTMALRWVTYLAVLAGSPDLFEEELDDAVLDVTMAIFSGLGETGAARLVSALSLVEGRSAAA